MTGVSSWKAAGGFPTTDQATLIWWFGLVLSAFGGLGMGILVEGTWETSPNHQSTNPNHPF